jgi:hypothetical protein
VYDYQLVFASGKPEFKQWSENVPTFSYNKAVPYFQVCSVKHCCTCSPCLQIKMHQG